VFESWGSLDSEVEKVPLANIKLAFISIFKQIRHIILL